MIGYKLVSRYQKVRTLRKPVGIKEEMMAPYGKISGSYLFQ